MPVERGLGYLAHNAAANLGVSDHAYPPHFFLTGLELRLDHCQCLPTRRGQCQRRWKYKHEADEGNVADDQLRREGEIGELAGVRALEHDHARVVPEFLGQLSV